MDNEFIKEEYLDVVSEADEVIGRALRKQCHKDYSLIHRTVHFIVYDPKRKQFLMDRRPLDAESDPGKLAIFGEHVLSGENYVDGLVRGVKEGLGLSSGAYTYKYLHKILFRDPEKYKSGSELVELYLVNIRKIPTAEIKNRSLIWVSPEILKSRDNVFPPATNRWFEEIDITGYLPR